MTRVRYGNPLSPLGDILRLQGDVPGLVRLFVSMAAAAGYPDHPAPKVFKVRYDNIRTALRDGMVKLQQNGRIRADVDLDAVARLALAAADGIQHQWLVDPEVDMGAVIDTIVSLVLLPEAPGGGE